MAIRHQGAISTGKKRHNVYNESTQKPSWYITTSLSSHIKCEKSDI